MTDCIFCKIIKKELPSKVVYEDTDMLAFYDIAPQAPIHLLFVPKEHFESLREAKGKHEKLLGKMLLKLAKVARDLGVDKKGYRVTIANGAAAGQEVFHLHIHLMGGWK